jgi:hypothetical protein
MCVGGAVNGVDGGRFKAPALVAMGTLSAVPIEWSNAALAPTTICGIEPSAALQLDFREGQDLSWRFEPARTWRASSSGATGVVLLP